MKKIFAAVLLMLGIAACEQYNGPVIDTGGSGCQSGLVQIGVGDGFLEYLCGCSGQPAGGTILPAPASLTCTVSANSVIMFQYIGIHTTHQIVGTGPNPLSVTGGPIDPSQGNVPLTSAAQVTGTGTYDFEDAFDTALTGKIVVP